MSEEQPIVFWQMPPCWGLPNASPFCMKLETWLRMAGLPYVAKSIEGPPKSASGKLPYIERPDGSFLWDSSEIIETLTRERNVTLDAGLSEGDHALGLLLQRTLEEDLYFIVLHDRWVDDAGWKLTEPAYFGGFPWLLRTLVLPSVRRKTIAAARGQGVARLPGDARHKKGVADIQAIARILGDKPYFLGRPSRYDAIAYAFLANVLQAPMPSAARDAVRGSANLVAYCQRMKDTYFQGWTPST
jgi:glutathione S-transferase